MRLEVSVPAKIILLGEWAVLDGHSALACALSPRFITRVKTSPSHPESKAPSVSFTSPRDHQSLEWDSRAALPAGSFFEKAATTLAALSDPSNAAWYWGAQFHFDRDWDVREGLGSSSALVLSLVLLNDLAAQKLEMLPTDENERLEIFARALTLIRKTQGGRGSGLDLATQLWGSTVLMKDLKPRPHTLPIPDTLCIVHTGSKTSTTQALERHDRTQKIEILKTKIAQSTQKFLSSGETTSDRWLEAFSEHADALEEAGLVPPQVMDARKDWRRLGLIEDLKTTGAGGGDALLVLIKSNEGRERLNKEISERGWWLSTAQWNAPGARFENAERELSVRTTL